MFRNRTTRWIIAGTVLLALFSTIFARSDAQGGELRYGESVKGSLKAGTTDVWHFIGGSGDIIGLTVQRTSDNLEPVLLVEDSTGQPVTGAQAAPGQGTVSLIQVKLSSSGSFLVRVSSGKTTGAYTLNLTPTAVATQAPTLEATAAAEVSAGTLSYGAAVQGELNGTIYRQVWRFRGAFGDVVDLRVVGKSGNLQPAIALISPLGEVLADNEAAAGSNAVAVLAYQLPFTGEYSIATRRAGRAGGQFAQTSGRYELTISNRGPGAATQSTVVTVGTTIQGRLSEQVKQAIYRLDVGGSLVTQLDLGSLHRTARVRFLTTTGSALGTFEGRSPLIFSTRLPDRGPFLVEVSSAVYDGQSIADFGLSIYRLSPTTTTTQPLRYGDTRRGNLAGDERYFLVGRSGDIANLTITPDAASLSGTVKITGPQNILLFQGYLGPGIQQNLTLPDTGLYELELFTPEDRPLTYTMRLERTGAANIPFARFDVAMDRGPLSQGTVTNSTLNASGADAWWLDATAGQVINLVASPVGNSAPGLALRRPDGSLFDVQVSERLQGAVIQQAKLDQSGRYRVIVFDSRASAGGQYALRVEPLSGGELPAGKLVKGIASPANGLSSWTIDISAGALINVRLTTFTPRAWTPSLSIADPSGVFIASATMHDAEADLLGVQAAMSGKYTVIVAGPVTGAFASYNLIATVESPFALNTAPTIQVASLTGTRPPLGRYVGPLPAGPVQFNVSDLLNPPLNAEKALATKTQIVPGTSVRGEIANGLLFQAWHLTIPTETTIMLQATSLTSGVGPNLTILGGTGKIVNEQYHGSSATTILTFRPQQSGDYYIVVRMGLNGGRYLLSLSNVNVINGPLVVAAGIPVTYGQLVPGEIVNADDQDIYYFLGLANDVISVQTTRAASDLAPGVQLFGPRGIQVSGDGNASSQPTATLTAIRLPDSGIYKLIVKRGDNGAKTNGRYTLYLSLDGGSRLRKGSGGIITPGATRTGLLNPPQNEDTWLFQGHMGQRVNFLASGLGDVPPTPLELRLQDTNGQTFAMQSVTLTQSGVQLSDVMLPADGIYRIQVTGASQTAGSYSLTWQPEPERLSAGAMRYNQTVNGVFTQQHSADSWVFSGTAGDIISIALRYQRGDRFAGGLQVRAGNGVPLVTVPDLGDGSGAHADNLLLPFDGSYTVSVANPDTNFKGAGVYSLSVNLQDSKARSMGGALRYGAQGQGALYSSDPTDTWVFTARGGDVVRLTAQAQDIYLRPSLELRSPDGKSLASTLPSAGQRVQSTIDNYAIPVDGVYVVSVNGGPDKTVGNYLLSLDLVPTPPTDNEVLHYGETNEDLIADDRPSQVRVFSGTQGDSITATVSRESGANLGALLELHTESGTVLATADSNGQESVAIRDFKLPQSGKYLLFITRYLGKGGKTAGRYKVSLAGTAAVRPTRGSIKYDQLALNRLSDQNPVDHYTFSGKAGDVLNILSEAKSGDLDTTLTLENSAGIIIAANDDARGFDSLIEGLVLPADDTYTVTVSRIGGQSFGSSGNYELHVYLLYRMSTVVVPKSLLAYGQRVTGAVDPQNSEVRYPFVGNQNDEITIQMLHQADDAPPLLSIEDPSGAQLAKGAVGVGQTIIDHFHLPASGLYSIVLRRPTNTQQAFSPYELTLKLVSSAGGQANGGVLHLNDAVTGAFSPGGALHYWLFQGIAGQTISVNLLQLTGNLLPAMILVGPDGQAITSAAVPQNGQSVSIDRFALPADGVYSLLVLPGDANRAGQYRLTLQVNVGAGPAPAPFKAGDTVSGTVNALQTSQQWTFDGSQGQTITVRMLTTSGNLLPQLTLRGPDGRIVAAGHSERVLQGRGMESAIFDFALPSNGAYILVAGTQQPGAGTYRLSMEWGALSPEAVAADPLVYGQTVRRHTRDGATDLWAFNGATGDTVNITALLADSSATSGKVPSIALQDVSGRVLARVNPANAGETTLDNFTLPGTGRYVIVVSASSTVDYILLAQRRQNMLEANVRTRPIVPDRPLDGVVTLKDIVEHWTFSAKAGRVIQVAGSRLSGDLRLDLSLYGPNSNFIGSATAGPDGASFTFGPLRLPDDGTYTLVATRWLGPAGKTAGRYTLVLTNSPNASGSAGGFIPLYNRLVTGGLIDTDPEDRWTFDGQAGEVVNVRMTRLDGNLVPLVKLLPPENDSPLASAQAANQAGKSTPPEALISRAILPVTGRYTVIATRSVSTSGGYRLVVERVQAAIQTSVTRAEGINLGEQRSGELTEAVPNRAWVFFGKAGEHISVDVTADSGSNLDPFIYILAPDGTTLVASTGSGNSARLASILLPGDGFYGVVIAASPLQQDNQQKRTGSFTLRVQQSQPGAVYQGRLEVGSDADGTLSSDQPIQEWAFATNKPVVITIKSPSPAFNSAITIVTADGKNVVGPTLAKEGKAILSLDAASISLQQGSDQYALLLSANVPGTGGRYKISLSAAIR